MAEDPIPERVKEFISENIDSIAELEALMLMFRNPAVGWSAASLAERLYSSPDQAEEAIAKLHALGLSDVKAKDPDTYHYRPLTPELGTMVEQIAETYSKYLVPVTNLIHSKPQTKVQQFADAFKLRKRRDE